MKLGLGGKAKIFKEKYTEKYTVIDDLILPHKSIRSLSPLIRQKRKDEKCK